MPQCANPACKRWRPDWLARHVGLTFENAWSCTDGCLAAVVRDRLREAGQARPPGQVKPPYKLGVLLVTQGSIQPPDVHAALERQQETGLRLGAQLRELGRVSSTEILKALAAQARVDYLTALNLGRVRQGPGDFSRDAVRALGVVPFEADLDRRRLKVACVAPLPRISLGAVRAVTGWEVGPFLVADETWPALAEAYGAARETGARNGHGGFVDSVDEAAARIVEMIAAGGVSRMIHTAGDPWLWVRLEGTAAARDLVVPRPDVSLEDAWQAART